MKRVSLATSLIQNFDKSLKERILGANISKEALNRFREKEKKDSVKILTDLQDLKSKSESQVYEVLNTMVKNSQFFMYCGPLLLNIKYHGEKFPIFYVLWSFIIKYKPRS